MRRLKLILFVVFLAGVQSLQYLFPYWAQVNRELRYAGYIAILIIVLMAGRYVLNKKENPWQKVVWTWFFVISFVVMSSMGGLNYFFSSIAMTNFTSYTRYFLMSPFPFLIIYFLGKINIKGAHVSFDSKVSSQEL